MQAKVRPCAWPPGPPGPSPSSNFQRAGEDLTLTGEEERKGDLPRELLKPFFVPFFEGTWPTFLPLRAEGVGTDEGDDRGEDRRSLRGAGKMPPPPGQTASWWGPCELEVIWKTQPPLAPTDWAMAPRQAPC